MLCAKVWMFQSPFCLQGICDGAGVVIVASENACSKYNLTPLARLVAYDVVGVDPTIMGIGPAYAIQNVLKKAQMTFGQH